MKKMEKLILLLTLLALFSCKTKPVVIPDIEEPIVKSEHEIEIIEEPVVVIEPVFNIVSIIIIQADLVNTLCEAIIRIDNPNEFIIYLSSLNYELYGDNYLWASGLVKEILQVPAKSFCEKNFIFSMNFINTSRKLLDDIIAMRNVQFRFKGNVVIETEFPRQKVPPFFMNFERSGYSHVIKKAK